MTLLGNVCTPLASGICLVTITETADCAGRVPLVLEVVVVTEALVTVELGRRTVGEGGTGLGAEPELTAIVVMPLTAGVSTATGGVFETVGLVTGGVEAEAAEADGACCSGAVMPVFKGDLKPGRIGGGGATSSEAVVPDVGFERSD